MRTIDIELHEAVTSKNYERVKKLLDKGADPNSVYTNGYSPLMHAVQVWENNTEDTMKIVRLLLDYGADPGYTAENNYQAILLTHDPEVVSLLLDAGVKIDRKTATQLMYNFNGNTEIKKILGSRGITETDWVDSVRQVYDRIYDYEDNHLYRDVLENSIPFLNSVSEKLEKYKSYQSFNKMSLDREDEYTFYALHRVNELLLLSFQEGSAEGTSVAKITMDEYIRFWTKLGFEVVNQTEFHPFFHEIYKVEQCEDEDYQPEIIKVQWPCLMFGELLFSRAGVWIRVGSNRIDKKTAENSTLYWSHRRNHRPYTDLSQGWGHNSQWSTSFRMDYWNKEMLYYNMNCDEGLIPEDDELSYDQRMEVLKHRCFVKSQEISDCYPYDYFATEKYKYYKQGR